jgi:hypothetical protein
MDAQSVMWLEMGNDQGIRCRFISEWFKMNSYVYTLDSIKLQLS